jgi:hypothetical protein
MYFAWQMHFYVMWISVRFVVKCIHNLCGINFLQIIIQVSVSRSPSFLLAGSLWNTVVETI